MLQNQRYYPLNIDSPDSINYKNRIMIDTIKLWIPAEELTHIDLLSELPLLLDEDSVNYYRKNNRDSVEGKVGNISVSIFETGISIYGSLSRYYFGDNFNTLSFAQIALAFERLAKQLNLPIEKSKLQRLDIAENFVVDHPTFHYYQFLGDLPRYNRTEQSNGIYYNQTNFQICVYDKVNEKKDKRKAIPDEYRELNVFRYEYRFLKKVGTNLSKKPVYVSDLLNPEFFSEILQVYLEKFVNINKQYEASQNTKLYTKDRAGLRNHLYYLGVQSLGGEGAVIKKIKLDRKHHVIKNGTQSTRMIQDVKKACKLGPFNSKSILIEELEQKVHEKVGKYL
jgi:hypothetical protein